MLSFKDKNYKMPATGALKSPLDVRTFSYPTKTYNKQKGGKRYDTADIENQSKVGICTAIHLTQNAKKATGIRYSADFQYLMQKKYFDANTSIGWKEGSSIFHALKVAKGIGLLPEKDWKWTTQADRNLPYHEYIKKLQTVPENEIARLILIANKHKIKAYSSIPVTRDAMAAAIDNSKAGILARFLIGQEWWTDKNGNRTWEKNAIQPLRKSKKVISGHAVIESNYSGNSFRIANTWGPEWADLGTAYYLLREYSPTECWIVWYSEEELPHEIIVQLESRASIVGKILNLIQQIIRLVQKLI